MRPPVVSILVRTCWPVLLICSCGGTQPRLAPPPGSEFPISNEPVSHAPLARVLRSATGAGSRSVQYAAVRDESLPALDSYLASLAAAQPARWSVNEQKAFWINAHNALALRLIAANWPVASVSEEGTLFGKALLESRESIAGEDLNPPQIRERLLTVFGDPRVLFALNWGAAGCVPLSREPFEAFDVDMRLEQLAREYLAEPDAIRTERRDDRLVLRMAGLLEFLEPLARQSETSVPAVLAPIVPALKAQAGAPVLFDPFDWSVPAAN